MTLVEALPPIYYEKEHLPGALNLPDDEVDERAPALLPDRDAEIVVYCASGPRQNSGIAARRLAALGCTNVSDYHEGKAEWIAAGLPGRGRRPGAVRRPRLSDGAVEQRIEPRRAERRE